MKSSQLYQHLTELAEKLSISVSEQNLSQSGVVVQSGLCKVEDEHIYVMDKRLTAKRKIDLLADCLADFDLENIYLVPALRELMLARKSSQALSKMTKGSFK